jgi:replicative DNA helicase
MAADVHRLSDLRGPDPACELEQNFLATCMLAPKALEALPEGFGAHHLHYDGHSDIFEAIKAAEARGVPVLLPLVKAALPHLGGPGGYIERLVRAYQIADLRGFRGYAEAIMEASDRRALIAVADNIRHDALAAEDSPPVDAIAAKALAEIDRIAAGQKRGKAAISLADAVAQAIRAGELAAERGHGLSGISSGFACIDNRLGGMEPGAVYVLGARPGVGKTAMGMQIALRVARKAGPVVFFSLEMEARQIARRALAITSGLGLKALKRGDFAKDEAMSKAVVKGQGLLADLPVVFHDEPGMTTAAMALRLKTAQREHGDIALVVIDHLHIVGRPDGSAKQGDTWAITEISMAVKRLAKEFGVPILLLAQLNRTVEGQEDKRPSLAHLRQSGAIEQDADGVIFIYRPDYYTANAAVERRQGDTDEKYYQRALAARAYAESVEGKAELLFEKVRDGDRGTEHLRFDAERVRFFEEGERA